MNVSELDDCRLYMNGDCCLRKESEVRCLHKYQPSIKNIVSVSACVFLAYRIVVEIRDHCLPLAERDARLLFATDRSSQQPQEEKLERGDAIAIIVGIVSMLLLYALIYKGAEIYSRRLNNQTTQTIEV